ncbi:MAG: GNAT family N-acetyltransferase [Oligoflexia bacterium]|nr:GNAT family N-acetyltransferase [Oligoflexia bacterium]
MANIKSLQIIEANVGDHLTAIVNFQIAMADETENLKLDPLTVKKGVTAVFDDPHRGKYYVCVETFSHQCSVKVVASMLTIPEWSDWRNATCIWIHSVYVVPEYRRQRIFAMMYDHLKEKVISNSEYFALRLYVDKRNVGAQNVYQRLGMNNHHYLLYEWIKV